MNKRYDRIVLFVLSLIVFITTIMGLIIPNVYENRNNSITTFEINGQDIISLIVSLAFLVILSINKLYYSRKDVIIGFLVYFLYTYLFFSVGLIFSKIFVMYLFINTISLFCLINQIIIIYNEKLYLHKANKSISIYIFIIVC